MSIKSTKYITRGVAESRIIQIMDLIQTADWTQLRSICDNDEEWFKEDYINYYNDIFDEIIDILKSHGNVSNFSNAKLERFMDEPGIRYSMFDNYSIIE